MLENKNLPQSRPRISGLRNFKSFVNLEALKPTPEYFPTTQNQELTFKADGV